MTKVEIIEKYGIEEYQRRLTQARNHQKSKEFTDKRKSRIRKRYSEDSEYRLKVNKRNRERYQLNDEYRNIKNMKNREYSKLHYNKEISSLRSVLHYRKSYVKDGRIELIENYELAKAENFIGWDIHHRLELTLDGEYAHSKEELIRLDMYYNRPYFELIWLPSSIHQTLHMKAFHAKLHSKTSPGSFVNRQ